MKIAVLSDTHMPKRARELPKNLQRGLKDVDLILHAGDFQTFEVYESLSSFAPIEGVYGNVDGEDLRARFEKALIISYENVNIGLTHGDGKSKTTEKRALEIFQYEDVDIIIFGHSHIPLLKEHDDLILFNPGSPTDKRKQALYSYGLITIEEKVTIEHIFYEDKT